MMAPSPSPTEPPLKIHLEADLDPLPAAVADALDQMRTVFAATVGEGQLLFTASVEEEAPQMYVPASIEGVHPATFSQIWNAAADLRVAAAEAFARALVPLMRRNRLAALTLVVDRHHASAWSPTCTPLAARCAPAERTTLGPVGRALMDLCDAIPTRQYVALPAPGYGGSMTGHARARAVTLSGLIRAIDPRALDALTAFAGRCGVILRRHHGLLLVLACSSEDGLADAAPDGDDDEAETALYVLPLGGEVSVPSRAFRLTPPQAAAAHLMQTYILRPRALSSEYEVRERPDIALVEGPVINALRSKGLLCASTARADDFYPVGVPTPLTLDADDVAVLRHVEATGRPEMRKGAVIDRLHRAGLLAVAPDTTTQTQQTVARLTDRGRRALAE